jgi:hypothetical protein
LYRNHSYVEIQPALQLLELDPGAHLLVERRGAQQDRGHRGAADEEDVGRHAQLLGRVEERRAEDVDHDRGDRACQAGHDHLDLGHVQLHVAGDELLDAGVVGRGLRGTEVVEADVQAAGFVLAYALEDLGLPLPRRRRHYEHIDGEGAAADGE